ncbi:MAG: polymer-forming cytoskeletal protein [Elusimicrobia bacterium]|nr:polymer-forming cytoskeletal protein [Elusimicrobiota bacterium]
MNGSGKMETIIGAGTRIEGSLSSDGGIRIDGKLEGNVTEAAQVIVGEMGEVQGDVRSSVVVVGGKVIGNVQASESLEILSRAVIHGDIKAGSLTIAEGAAFEGSCTMTREKNVIELVKKA